MFNKVDFYMTPNQQTFILKSILQNVFLKVFQEHLKSVFKNKKCIFKKYFESILRI